MSDTLCESPVIDELESIKVWVCQNHFTEEELLAFLTARIAAIRVDGEENSAAFGRANAAEIRRLLELIPEDDISRDGLMSLAADFESGRRG